MDCDKCRIATIVEGLDFSERQVRVRSSRENQKPSSVFDLDMDIIVDLMKRLGFSRDQQEQAIQRITKSALEICLEIANRPDTNQQENI